MGNHVNGGAGVRRKIFFFGDVVYGQKRLRTPAVDKITAFTSNARLS